MTHNTRKPAAKPTTQPAAPGPSDTLAAGVDNILLGLFMLGDVRLIRAVFERSMSGILAMNGTPPPDVLRWRAAVDAAQRAYVAELTGGIVLAGPGAQVEGRSVT